MHHCDDPLYHLYKAHRNGTGGSSCQFPLYQLRILPDSLLGRVMAQGTPAEVTDSPDSLTGRYLAQALRIPVIASDLDGLPESVGGGGMPGPDGSVGGAGKSVCG